MIQAQLFISMRRWCVTTDDEAEENEGDEARMSNQSLKDGASNAWNRGWHEEHEEWTGREGKAASDPNCAAIVALKVYPWAFVLMPRFRHSGRSELVCLLS